ncbi:MAG: hypothetical protein ACRDPW_04625 [Mycobacteriales bacterium]
MSEVLARIRSLRRSAARELASVLNGVIHKRPSEVELRDAWHERLAEDSATCSEGWYMPPPHGIVLAVGDPPLFERLSAPTFRPELTWPSTRHRLGRESLLGTHSSRVHQATGTIGDIGCALYRGEDPAIRAHLRQVWHVTLRIVEEVETGMTFGQLHDRAMNILRENDLANNTYRAHAGSETNIGHTIPWSNEPIQQAERLTLATGTPEQIAELVSGKRRFISQTESLEITEDVAFTIEPRLSRPGLPPAWFHVVVGFEQGKRVVITEFEPIFDAYGMNYVSA